LVLDRGVTPLGAVGGAATPRPAGGGAAPALAALRLPDTGCGALGAGRLGSLLRSANGPRLRELDVGWNLLGGGEPAAALCLAAGQARALRRLGPQWTGLGGGGGAQPPPACEALAAAMLASSTLEMVDCCGNRLGPAAGGLLAAAEEAAAASAWSPPCRLLLDPQPVAAGQHGSCGDGTVA
jgi:hypothetical protein